MNDINTLITDGLTYIKFQESPSQFLRDLKNIKKLHVSQDTYHNQSEYQDTQVKLVQCVNDTSIYETWYSPPLQWVFYATGDLLNENPSISFFTSDISIPQEMGIEIFDLLIELGADINTKNYYNLDICDIIKEDNQGSNPLTKRTNNEKFVNYIIDNHLPN